ncbi:MULTISPECIES: 4'-phosphopantetheinyl transferase family protein [unclassified Paenibacillus]|uniref:4'-phosphopantetheinyl transferase family protein n=1 Tax=unclassified Paenibacillus TaxID=185978 RepID=UPI00315B108E
MITPNLIAISEQEIEADDILSPYEHEIYDNITNEGRRKEFLVGRYAIKKNLKDQFPSYHGEMSNISVEYGSLRFPLIHDNLFEVGLSHSKTYALSVLYSKDNVVGVDIETIRSDIPIAEMLSEAEKKLIEHLYPALQFAYIFFSCKEALGKALKMGLLADYSIYEISEVVSELIHGQEVFRIQFKRFPFLTGYSFMKDDKEICSLVVPQKVDIREVLRLLIAS